MWIDIHSSSQMPAHILYILLLMIVQSELYTPGNWLREFVDLGLLGLPPATLCPILTAGLESLQRNILQELANCLINYFINNL